MYKTEKEEREIMRRINVNLHVLLEGHFFLPGHLLCEYPFSEICNYLGTSKIFIEYFIETRNVLFKLGHLNMVYTCKKNTIQS